MAGCGVAIVLHVWIVGNDLPESSVLQLAVSILGGTIVVALLADDLYSERSAESLLLVCWVFGTFVFAALMNWSVTARTLLPMAPPVAILIVRRMQRRTASGTPPRAWLVGLSLSACAAVSFAVGAADYVWAGSMRDAARSFIRESKRQTGTVYFQGHWGWQFYMEQGGCRALDMTDSFFRPGDFVISPQNNVNVEQIPARYARGVLTNEFPASRWLATTSSALGAGFYSDVFGPLPFVFGVVPTDPYHVILLGPPADTAVGPSG
jgi:hypothetical protein